MKRIVPLILAAAVLGLSILGCGPFGGSPTSDTAPPAVAPPATEVPPTARPEPTTPPFVGGECDSRSTRVDVNVSYDENMHSTTQSYPANCLYYCLWIPEAMSNLTIGVYDFDVDLDLYVGYGSMDAVSGSEVEQGETYTWKSNDYGTDDEQVSIRNPEGGVYYIEVCSYEGSASPFRLETALR
jgi:hypothetical protein